MADIQEKNPEVEIDTSGVNEEIIEAVSYTHLRAHET